ncbi:hypothetical protein BLOT_010317 [Blomia tropicalis]|nr:hypothetical protein BLOT_010317 [Blomia tropicalis]
MGFNHDQNPPPGEPLNGHDGDKSNGMYFYFEPSPNSDSKSMPHLKPNHQRPPYEQIMTLQPFVKPIKPKMVMNNNNNNNDKTTSAFSTSKPYSLIRHFFRTYDFKHKNPLRDTIKFDNNLNVDMGDIQQTMQTTSPIKGSDMIRFNGGETNYLMPPGAPVQTSPLLTSMMTDTIETNDQSIIPTTIVQHVPLVPKIPKVELKPNLYKKVRQQPRPIGVAQSSTMFHIGLNELRTRDPNQWDTIQTSPSQVQNNQLIYTDEMIGSSMLTMGSTVHQSKQPFMEVYPSTHPHPHPHQSPQSADPFEDYYSDRILPLNAMIDYPVWSTIPGSPSVANVQHGTNTNNSSNTSPSTSTSNNNNNKKKLKKSNKTATSATSSTTTNRLIELLSVLANPTGIQSNGNGSGTKGSNHKHDNQSKSAKGQTKSKGKNQLTRTGSSKGIKWMPMMGRNTNDEMAKPKSHRTPSSPIGSVIGNIRHHLFRPIQPVG